MKEPKDFFQRVYAVVRKIPRGRVTSYGAIADFLGTGLSARTVGWAMNSSAVSKQPVPAHRVVNRLGILTGKNHFSTPTLMQELLEAEGIAVENDRVKNFDALFWDPGKQERKTQKPHKKNWPAKKKRRSR
jgi:methylated-DNA-protein-cysteine methyltransferase-like protein